MSVKTAKSLLSENLLWLKWRLIVLGIALIFAIGLYLGSLYYRNSMGRLEQSVLTETEVLILQLRQIEDSRRIIIDNIDRFNTMVSDSVMDEENRVNLLENISDIRRRHNLFPIDIEIQEQERTLLQYDPAIELSDEQISLRSSRVQLRIPLLHEEDLTRFLGDFLNTGRLIFTDQCTVSKTPTNAADVLAVVEHQLATCTFYWFTLRREPFSGV